MVIKLSGGVSRTRYIISMTIAVLLAVFGGYFFVLREMRFFLVPSGSMEPTLYPGDRLITLDEATYQRGDIVVAKDPLEPKAFVVKRIAGVAGDRISIQGGALYLNGEYVSEPYTKEPMYAVLDPPMEVPEGSVLLLGDNRNESDDSLMWGLQMREKKTEEGEHIYNAETRVKPSDVYFPPVSSIVGRVRWIYAPASRRGLVESYPQTSFALE